ncbi:MAG: hypothetical protein AAF531_27225 [Actinomycetota bacterium]
MDVVAFSEQHLEPVADLLRRHVSPELDRDPARFRQFVDANYLRGPNRTDEVRSLVAVDEAGAVTGFCGVTAYPMHWRGRPILLAASGPLIADPVHRDKAPGLFLTRAVLGGPQDVAITDGANDEATMLWQRMKAEIVALPSARWLRPLRPSGLGLSLAAERFPAVGRLIGRTALLDRAVMRRFKPEPVPTTDRELDPDLLVELNASIGSAFKLRPEYNPATLAWQFEELRSVTVKGDLQARAVMAPDGRPIGWFVYYLLADGMCRVMQLGCRPRDAAAVVAHLGDHAARHDGGALFGRLEAHYWEAIRRQPVIMLREAPRMLIHAEDVELRGDIHAGRALVTRLEGEAWNGLHHQPMPA